MGSRGQQVARLVVIGGGAAGMSAASAARRTAPDLDVVVCESGGFAAYGMCGIPDYLGGVVAEAEHLLAYDTLVVATGADPVRPPAPGLGHDRVFTIRSLDEAIRLRRLLDSGVVRRALVIGAGYIGLETAEGLTSVGAEVDVIEALPQVLAGFDEPVADVVAAELTRHVRLRLGCRLDAVGDGDGDGGVTALVSGSEEPVDLVILATGVRPA